jgi:hypothetical protein
MKRKIKRKKFPLCRGLLSANGVFAAIALGKAGQRLSE